MYKELFFFEDLEKEVQEKVIENYKEDCREEYEISFLYEDIKYFIDEKIKEMGYEVIDLEVCYALDYCQGDGVSFSGVFKKDGKEYTLERNSSYCHEYTMRSLFYEDEESNIFFDEKGLEKMRTIAREAKKYGYDSIEGYTSEESIRDIIISNEDTFTSNGKMMVPDFYM